MTSSRIIKDFNEYIKKNRIANHRWYVGVTADPERRLFTDHKVKKEGGTWIHSPADSATIARAVEKAYLDAGYKGGGGGGDNRATTVYAYRIGPHTTE